MNIPSLLAQQLEQLGYQQALKALQQEANLSYDQQLRDQFMNGDYAQIIPYLNTISEVQQKEIQFEIDKQIYIEIVHSKEFLTAAEKLKSMLVNYPEKEQNVLSLSKDIFLQRQLNIENSRLQLFFRCKNYLSYGEMNEKTEIEKLIEKSRLYDNISCIYHIDENHKLCHPDELPLHLSNVICNFDDQVWIATQNHGIIACSTRKMSIYIIRDSKSFTRIPNAHSKDINCLLIADLLYSAANDNVINAYELTNGLLQFKIQQHQSPVLVITMINNSLISGGVDNWLGVWSKSGQLVHRIGQQEIVKNILHQDVIVIVHQKRAIVLDMNWNEISIIHENEQITSSELSKDSKWLLLNVSINFPCIHLWDIQKNIISQIFSGFQQQYTLNAIFVGEHEHHIGVGSKDGRIHFYDKQDQTKRQTLDLAHNDNINYLSYTNGTLISCSDDRSVKVWTVTQAPLQILDVLYREPVQSQEQEQELLESDSQLSGLAQDEEDDFF